ncbi:MAG: hypothetical protein HRT61_23370 [Ekhidna sp.]|nr:hypothetical protein [Ekhidna sp.]
MNHSSDNKDRIKSTKEDLLQSNIDFNIIEQIASLGSFVWDLREDFLECSPHFLRIVKIEKEDYRIDKDTFFELIDNDMRNFVLDVMHDCLISNDEFEVTFKLKKHEKKIRLFGYPQGDYDAKIITGLIQDMTGQEEASDALLKGQEDERKRISLELHDSIGQKLIAAKYQLAIIKMDPTPEKYQQLDDLINQIVGEVRHITHNLSSQMVIEVGLRNAIGQLLSDTAKYLNAKKEYRYELKDSNNRDLEIEEDAAKTIYRIVQEALTNATKHSKASNLKVSLLVLNNQVQIGVQDDGVGMETGDRVSGGIGLQNIQERVSYLNGFVKFISRPDYGMYVNIKIPLQNVLKM